MTGPRQLGGVVRIAGYKHALVPILAASAFVADAVEIGNVPDVLDTRVLGEILSRLGAQVEHGPGVLRIRGQVMTSQPVPDELSRLIHGSIYLVPSLLCRFGRVTFGTAGGCNIGDGPGGARPVEHIVSVLERFGATFERTAAGLVGRCGRLRAQTIDMREYSAESEIVSGPYVSGATKTALLAGVVAQGTTVIRNPHNKPDVAELVRFLRHARCEVEHTADRIVVRGGAALPSAVSHSLMSDPSEIMTFIAAAVHLGNGLRLGALTVELAREALTCEVERMQAMGIGLRWGRDDVVVEPPERLHAVDVEAQSRGVSTDSHPLFTLMLLDADGPSCVRERVWKRRFAYAAELNRLGADLKVGDGAVCITPRRPGWSGRTVWATDTRAGAVLVLAALGIEGRTTIEEVEHVDRGYDGFYEKLRSLGAWIEVEATA